MFEEALESYDGVPQEERAILVYLVGELWRRIGNVDKASYWFDLVASEITDPENQRWVVDAAQQQRVSPREWFC